MDEPVLDRQQTPVLQLDRPRDLLVGVAASKVHSFGHHEHVRNRELCLEAEEDGKRLLRHADLRWCTAHITRAAQLT